MAGLNAGLMGMNFGGKSQQFSESPFIGGKTPSWFSQAGGGQGYQAPSGASMGFGVSPNNQAFGLGQGSYGFTGLD